MASTVARFAPAQSIVEQPLWPALEQYYLDHHQLLTTDVEAMLFVPLPRSAAAANGAPVRVFLRPESINPTSHPPPRAERLLPLVLRIAPTSNDFHAAAKPSLLTGLLEDAWRAVTFHINNPTPQFLAVLENPALLAPTCLLVHLGVKKHEHLYWFAFPTFVPSVPFLRTEWVSLPTAASRAGVSSTLFTDLHHSFEAASCAIHVCVLVDGKQYSFSDGVHLIGNQQIAPHRVTFVHSDMSCDPDLPSSFIRNFLLFVARAVFYFDDQPQITIRCILWRDFRHDSQLENSSSYYAQFTWNKASQTPTTNVPNSDPKVIPEIQEFQANGWERDFDSKLRPRKVDLSEAMDPVKLSETSVDLNLKLMKWRLMPSLKLDSIKDTKCLLLGAGTLGTYVARSLVAWGVRHITFVDYGNVSYSNPARQPLFTFEDASKSKRKAAAAAENLKLVTPGISCRGEDLSIPMPGHNEHLDVKLRDRIKKLEELIDEHNVIYLLMDSRESRWLPSLICAAKGKIVINAALGFDTYVVMRHGVREVANVITDGQAEAGSTIRIGPQPALGCYFCNDVVAPTDSLSNRTLDQQCTVTRPGVSAMASAYAVEVMVSIINHPLGPYADAPVSADASNVTEPTEQPLGLLPHQIRGYLSHFNNLLVKGASFERCTACSDAVVNAYLEGGHDFLVNVLADNNVLISVAKLDELYKEGDDIDVDWIEDEDEDEGDGEDNKPTEDDF